MLNLTKAQFYKTFYVRNFRIFVISWSVCQWQAFTAQSNVCGQSQELILELSPIEMLHSGRLQPYPQAERLAKEKPSRLLQKFANYGHKPFYNIGPKISVNFPLCYLRSHVTRSTLTKHIILFRDSSTFLVKTLVHFLLFKNLKKY